jgi:ribosomal protein S18 acetylase RimI-like enzyme
VLTGNVHNSWLVEKDFETAIFGGPVYELKFGPQADRYEFERVTGDIAKVEPKLVSCRLSPELSAKLAPSLREINFRHVETLSTLSTLSQRIGSFETKSTVVELGAEKDIDEICKISAKAFIYDRFHADPKVANRIADEIKRQWARNAVLGRANKVLIVRNGGVIQGFCACLRAESRAIIDLIAVSPAVCGQGIGSLLLAGVFSEYEGVVSEIHVGTQISNKPSLRLYRRFGFEEIKRVETYHWTPEA